VPEAHQVDLFKSNSFRGTEKSFFSEAKLDLLSVKTKTLNRSDRNEIVNPELISVKAKIE